jgi:RNA polymerase sigma factor (sigma-70 family)
MDRNEKNALVTALMSRYEQKLRGFLEARLRHAMAEVPDLMQQVCERLLRLGDPEAIRSPEAYLFSIARSVLHEHRRRRSTQLMAIDIEDVLAELADFEQPAPEERIYAQQRLAEIERALAQLPRKAYVTLILNRVAGLPLDQVAARLGISRSMAKKYLAKALAQCRRAEPDGPNEREKQT